MVKPVIVEGYPPASTVEGEFRDDSGPFDLLSSAGRLGSWAWTEARLHRIVGGWAPDADGAHVVVVLDRLAMGHAARSALLVDRLPRLRELPRDALVRSPGAAADAVLEQLGALSQGDRLAAWVVVASALADAYDAHLSRCTPVADRPLLARLPAQLDRLRADAVDARTRIGPDRPPVEMLDLLEATCGFTA